MSGSTGDTSKGGLPQSERDLKKETTAELLDGSGSDLAGTTAEEPTPDESPATGSESAADIFTPRPVERSDESADLEDETLLADAPPHGDSLAARLRAGVSRLLRIMTVRADEWETAAETRAREEELAARVWDAMRIAAGLDQTPGGSQPTPSHSPPRAGGNTFDIFAGGLSVHFLGEEGEPPSAAGAYQAPPQQEAWLASQAVSRCACNSASWAY